MVCGFIDFIARPMFTILTNWLPSTKETLLPVLEDNYKRWSSFQNTTKTSCQVTLSFLGQYYPWSSDTPEPMIEVLGYALIDPHPERTHQATSTADTSTSERSGPAPSEYYHERPVSQPLSRIPAYIDVIDLMEPSTHQRATLKETPGAGQDSRKNKFYEVMQETGVGGKREMASSAVSSSAVSHTEKFLSDLENKPASLSQSPLSLPSSTPGFPYPRVRGQVRCRLQELEGIPDLALNANNVPLARQQDQTSRLCSEIVDGFRQWANAKGQVISCTASEVVRCMQPIVLEERGYLDKGAVLDLKARLDGLVLTPLDRNPGVTLVICPALYYQGMFDLFIRNDGYVPIVGSESDGMAATRECLRKEGLLAFGKWDGKGHVGKAYALPKHKDLDRYRLICPTFSEPTARTGKAVAKGLNHLLFTLPQDLHFNLKALSSLTSRLEAVNRKCARQGSGVVLTARSYDIKDMFSQLPHDEILQAVDWVIKWHKEKGRQFVRVNTRGRGSTFGLTTGQDHWRLLEFDDVFNFIRIDLKHTYTSALNVLLQQRIGIPMGKSTSPPLACILCAHAEHKFLCSLGTNRQRVFGVRLVDDVSLIIASKTPTEQEVDGIWQRFEECYPSNLSLKRTDDGTGKWDFLGCEVKIDPTMKQVLSVQLTKNEKTLWTSEILEFKNGQSYRSWGSKSQKSAVIAGHLHRID
ncbi:hypothetical protein CBR_g8473 [Chara braunii]|uniref:Reverse transcriptase domain-containing protein n=1 Tax=Chara braunii TaxID=69332 RepID=A0A388KM95_CHABU|nr:hypothetical protein CBR_g8473 [Chara braunii]|eukprot:GBG71171.1 hypothetical protein CBR_g8473 [Chara braunii]